MDRGISVAWYDLPENGGEDYLELAARHRTSRSCSNIRGVLWAAHYRTDESDQAAAAAAPHEGWRVPGGHAYIFLLGAEDAHASPR